MAEEIGLKVDTEGYHAALKEEQDRNAAAVAKRKAARSAGADMTFAAEQTSAIAHLAKTDDAAKYVWNERPDAKIVALFVGRGGGPKGDGFVDSVDASNQVAGAVLDATSFYAEMGGQTFDTGSLLIDDSSVLQVDDVQVYAGYIVHVGAPSTTLKLVIQYSAPSTMTEGSASLLITR